MYNEGTMKAWMPAYEYPPKSFQWFLFRALSLCAGHDYEAVLAGA